MPGVDAIDPGAAIALSLWVATWCTVLGAPPAIALGWVLARREFLGKAWLSALVLTPMVLPPVVTGLVLLRIFGRRGVVGPWLGAIGIEIAFTPAAALIAAIVVGFPLFVLSARAAFVAVDPGYDELAATLGDGPARRFWRVTLPLAGPGLVGGALLMFARSLGEFGATIVLAGNSDDTRTIALAIYSLLERPGGQDQAWSLAWASVVISLVALLGYEWFIRRQRRRLELQ